MKRRGITARERKFRVGAGPNRRRTGFAALSARTICGIGSPASSDRQRGWRNTASLLNERSVPRPSNSLDPGCRQGGRSTARGQHSRRPSHTRCAPGSSASNVAAFAQDATSLGSSLSNPLSQDSRLRPFQRWRVAYVGQVSNPVQERSRITSADPSIPQRPQPFADSKICSL
jgi:hypothetical protein